MDKVKDENGEIGAEELRRGAPESPRRDIHEALRTRGRYHGGQNDYRTGVFLFRPSISVKTTRILQKTPNSGKMTIMILLSELILVFFFFLMHER